MQQDQTIHIPKSLYVRIQEVIKHMGFKSVPEYVRSAIRQQLPKDELHIELRQQKESERENII